MTKDWISSISDATAVKIASINFLVCLVLFGCSPKSTRFEPTICTTPSGWHVQMLPSPFPSLTHEEMKTEWGKELHIAKRFAKEQDLYRAITSYKRASFLIPKDEIDRRREIDWGIVLCYFLGQKYSDVIETFEKSTLVDVPSSFPPYRDLILILQESYKMSGASEKGALLFELLEKGDPETAEQITLSEHLLRGNLQEALTLSPQDHELLQFSSNFCRCYKSPKKAQTLNAVLPGAGYWYVGQKRSAVTSLVINAATTAAAWYFFDTGNWGAGVLMSSLEMGWYFGGINGAGLAAKEFNERTYERCMKELMERKRLFPILMLEVSF